MDYTPTFSSNHKVRHATTPASVWKDLNANQIKAIAICFI